MNSPDDIFSLRKFHFCLCENIRQRIDITSNPVAIKHARFQWGCAASRKHIQHRISLFGIFLYIVIWNRWREHSHITTNTVKPIAHILGLILPREVARCHNHHFPFRLFQYGLLHRGQTTGFSRFLGAHSCVQRSHLNPGIAISAMFTLLCKSS